MKYLYIHGANATGQSFNFIRNQIGGSDIVLEYDSANGFKYNLETMLTDLKDQENMFVIAHSLGGIYALNIANKLPKSIRAALTLATPYGGSSIASFASMMLPYSKLLRDITPTSDVIRSAAEIKISIPWYQVITTRGNAPWLQTPNDGIITRDSMTARSDIQTVEMDTNHYEVVLDPRTVDLIKKLSIPQK
jgi:pimeloyl-ACP methyl ester carboxylesterase